MAEKIRFYLDENLSVAVAEQLQRRGIEAITARDLDRLGDSDPNHLRRATAMGCVLCTNDPDFVELAAAGAHHAGVVLGHPAKQGIGDWGSFPGATLCGVST